MTARQRWTLVLVCTAAFMLLLDITVISVALPSIQLAQVDLRHADGPDFGILEHVDEDRCQASGLRAVRVQFLCLSPAELIRGKADLDALGACRRKPGPSLPRDEDGAARQAVPLRGWLGEVGCQNGCGTLGGCAGSGGDRREASSPKRGRGRERLDTCHRPPNRPATPTRPSAPTWMSAWSARILAPAIPGRAYRW